MGICLIGTDSYSQEQWAALRELVQRLRSEHPITRIIGHHEVNPGKTCPGFDVQAGQTNPAAVAAPSKGLLQSKTVWGVGVLGTAEWLGPIIATTIVGLAKMLGYDVLSADAQFAAAKSIAGAFGPARRPRHRVRQTRPAKPR